MSMRNRNPLELSKYIRSMITEKDKEYYVFIDEIQLVKDIKKPLFISVKGFVSGLQPPLTMINKGYSMESSS